MTLIRPAFRNEEHDGSAVAGPTLDLHATAVRFRNAPHDGQPETGAARSRAEKWIHGAPKRLRIHPGPFIRHLYDGATLSVHVISARRYHDGPPFRHGLFGVVDDV